MHRLADVGKSITHLPKASTAVTTHSQEKLVTAKISAPCSTSIEVQYVEHVQPVVSIQQVDKAATTISEVKKADVDSADVCKNVVGQAEPLNNLNMQLKRVYGDACMPADRGQRWSLFQTQCMIKGKVCKLIVDGGSYCNGISKGYGGDFGFFDMVYS
jgi:hypothetical protein